MVQQAVRAWQLIRAIKAQDIELLYGLPDWAVSAAMSQQVFMTNEDEYSGLWISYPIDTDEMHIEVLGLEEDVEVDSVAFRAQPRDVLLYRGGIITVLTTPREQRYEG
jgi:hypothetical protein